MPQVRPPYFKVIYQSVDITNDIADDVVDIAYDDAVTSESPEMRIVIDDMTGKWKKEWRPKVGDKITLQIGYSSEDLLDCGSFEIDEVHYRGQPDQVEFRGLAIGVSNDLLTKKSRAFEAQTLRQVAQQICGENSLTFDASFVNGVNVAVQQMRADKILDLSHRRLAQFRETDIAFLNRIGNRYGLFFNVFNNKMYPLLEHSLHNIDPIADCVSSELYRPFYGLMEASFEELLVDRPIQDYLSRPTLEIKSYDLKECMKNDPTGVDVVGNDSYTSTPIKVSVENEVSFADRGNQIWEDIKTKARLQTFMKRLQDDRDKRAADYQWERTKWRMKVYEDVESATQGEIVAVSSLYRAITNTVDGRIDIEGLPRCVAGTSVNVRGLQWLDGKYYVTKSRHRITRQNGYTTSLDVQLVGESIDSVDTDTPTPV